MKELIDFDGARIFAIPTIGGMADGGGLDVHQGMVIEGPQGWGEFSPSRDCPDAQTARWLTAAIEGGTVGWPDPVRGRVPIAVTVPAVDPEAARAIVVESGCRTARVTMTGPATLAADLARLEAVRAALGPQGAIRCHTSGSWDVDAAVSAIAAWHRAAGGLEFVEHPCRGADELAAVRRKVDVPLAVEVSMELTGGPLAVVDAADIVILRAAPLGGARRALRVAEKCGLPAVVSSSPQTSLGLSAGLALAGALPELPFACSLDVLSALTGDLVTGARSLTPLDGHLPVAPMPPQPDPQLLATYALTDPAGIAWWRQRVQTLRATL